MTYRTLIAALLLTGASVAAPASATAAGTSVNTTAKPTFHITIHKLIKITQPRVDTVDFSGTYRCTGTDPDDVIQFFFVVSQTRHGTTVSTSGDQLQNGTTCDGQRHKYTTSTLNAFGGQFRPGFAKASVNASTHDTEGNTLTKDVQKHVFIYTTHCRAS